MDNFDYFSLVRRSDNKEVYTSIAYTVEGCDNIFDFNKIGKTLGFYFKRVNSGIESQLASTRLTDEQKSQLKPLDACDYFVKFKKHMPVGYAEHVYWIKNVKLENGDFIRFC